MKELQSDQAVHDAQKTWVGLALGLWLAGVFAASLFGRLDGELKHSFSMMILTASLMWPPIYFLLSRCRFVPSGVNAGTIVGLALFGLFCGMSSFISRAPMESTTYTAMTILTILIVLQFNANLDAARYETGLKTYAIVMAALVLGFSAYDYVPGTRLGKGKDVLNPASLALVTMSVFISAMAVRRALFRIPLLVSMASVIFLTGARASAVAALFGFSVTLLFRRRAAGVKGLVLLAVCVAVGGALALYYADTVIRGASEFFAIQDRHRGLESGGSGRLATWKATWDLFLSHPALGVGFRAHEQLLKINSSAHNGYLALLAEIGMIGFAAALYVVLSGMWRTWRRAQDPTQAYTYSVLLGLGSGYFILAVFERYFINVGNPTSLLFLLAVLTPSLAPRESAEGSPKDVQPPSFDNALGVRPCLTSRGSFGVDRVRT
jgi:O-antigen ligase